MKKIGLSAKDKYKKIGVNTVFADSLNTFYGTGVHKTEKDKLKSRKGKHAMKLKKNLKKYEY